MPPDGGLAPPRVNFFSMETYRAEKNVIQNVFSLEKFIH